MNDIQVFFSNNGWLLKVIYSILMILIIALLYKAINKFIEKTIGENKIFNNNKSKTYIKLAKSISKYISIIIALIIILKIFGVDVSSMLAGIGIIGVIVGLAIQDFLKDIIRGSSIFSDDYFRVGDVVKYNGIEGKVLVVGLKTTKIQELATGNIISIANRNIEEIAVLSKFIYVKVPLPYELKLNEQHKVIDDVVRIIKEDKLVENCENVGLTELADFRIEYLLRITINPINKLQARRNVLGHIIEGLEKNNIKVPYNQIDIHQK